MIVDCIKVKTEGVNLFYYTCASTKEPLGFGFEFGVVDFNRFNYELIKSYKVVVNDFKTI